MRITLEPTDSPIVSPCCTHPKVSVELPQNDLTMEEVIGNLIIPALLSMGFQKDTIDAYFWGE